MSEPQAGTEAGTEAVVEAVVERFAGRHVGLLVAVERGGSRVLRGRGTVGREPGAGPVPDGLTRFEIGSVTKVLTATLLAVMVESGEVALDEPLQDLVPDGVRLPVRGRPVTLLDLATHRSGLPRLPPGWLLRVIGHGDDPYARFTVDDVWAAAARTRRRRPGGRPRYSNLGMGLLGHALAHRAGRDWADLVVERVCRPLGLADTSTVVDLPGRPGAVGHDRRGRPVPAWTFPVLAGAGALRSTGEDLLRLLAAQDLAAHPGDPADPADEADPADQALRQAVRATHQVYARVGALGQCLGWMSLERRQGAGRVLWHNGGTGGFRSFVAVLPGDGLRVVVLAADPRPVDPVGQELIRLLAAG